MDVRRRKFSLYVPRAFYELYFWTTTLNCIRVTLEKKIANFNMSKKKGPIYRVSIKTQ